MPAGIGGDAHVDGRDMLRYPVIGGVCAVTDQDHSHIGGAWRPDWSRTVGDNQNIELKARRHAVDLFPHRARIAIDVDLSQLPPRCISTSAIPGALTTAALTGLP